MTLSWSAPASGQRGGATPGRSRCPRRTGGGGLARRLEGLSARSRALLIKEGLEPALEASAGIGAPVPRRDAWAGTALRSAALRTGVDCRWDTVVRSTHSGGLWQGRLRSGATVAAPQMIDARGRRGAARRGPLLLALGQEF
jgi:hypothetical protein